MSRRPVVPRAMPLLALLTVIACDPSTIGPDGVGFVSLQVTFAEGVSTNLVDGRVRLDGPTPVDRIITSTGGQHTIDGLLQGNYVVGLEQLAPGGGSVDAYAHNGNVFVTAGHNTPVTLNLQSFTGSLPASGTTVAGALESITVSPITNAVQYNWELDTNPGFGSPTLQITGSPSADFIFETAETHYVRVRGLNFFGGMGAWSNTLVMTVQAPPMIELDKANDSFVAPQGGYVEQNSQGLNTGEAATRTKSVRLTNSGGTPLTWQATPSEFWLDVTPSTGQLQPGNSVTINVILNRASATLPRGNYSNDIVFGEPQGLAQPVTYPVGLFVDVGPPAVPDMMAHSASPPNGLVVPSDLKITWRDNANDETHIQLEKFELGQGGANKWEIVQRLAPDTEEYTDVVLSGIKIFYRVRACNDNRGNCFQAGMVSLNGPAGPNAAHDQFNLILARDAEGRVVNQNGQGIGGVTVEVHECASATGATNPPSAGSCSQYSGLSRSGTTTSDGRFEISYLPEGIYEVRVPNSSPGAALYDLSGAASNERGFFRFTMN